MDPRLIAPLPPDSPWSSWTRPDIKHCEANLAGWSRPDDHLFQWHAAWHLLTAASFVPLARFHAALPEAA